MDLWSCWNFGSGHKLGAVDRAAFIDIEQIEKLNSTLFCESEPHLSERSLKPLIVKLPIAIEIKQTKYDWNVSSFVAPLEEFLFGALQEHDAIPVRPDLAKAIPNDGQRDRHVKH
eukprot:CAMPEP_0115053142 /NCGR_PEP_ID=MMETSP0227-20121206/3338_1 /TAXON_ID=89957 /ORGANISM="Polarella glacialis, Strain CCMP 1383" /LENGTH=114 /DNA_ID=CAMNT_0002437401 /DNA_START=205 /DNA_END=549 /DNA_ORIENTATION=-